MKLTKQQLRQIIKEEREKVLSEVGKARMPPEVTSEAASDPAHTGACETAHKGISHDEWVRKEKEEQSAELADRAEKAGRRLQQEGIKLTKSQLKQIIREELEIILTNEEVKELFGDDVFEGEEKNKKPKNKSANKA
jgi:hypothetical protein|tara:strand:- start:2635 stop:3045 length:411 start_codon:yes stop_codon:yes gene_type:complete